MHTQRHYHNTNKHNITFIITYIITFIYYVSSYVRKVHKIRTQFSHIFPIGK